MTNQEAFCVRRGSAAAGVGSADAREPRIGEIRADGVCPRCDDSQDATA